jgi:hypothetical protein
MLAQVPALIPDFRLISHRAIRPPTPPLELREVRESMFQRIFMLGFALIVGAMAWGFAIVLEFPGSMLIVTAVLVALKTALEIGLVAWPVEKDQLP